HSAMQVRAHLHPLSAAGNLPITRRESIRRIGMGVAGLGLAALVGNTGQPFAAEPRLAHPMLPKPPQFPVKAKHAIHRFMNGGPPHIDTLDPKPALEKYAGKELPGGNLRTERKTGACFPSPFKFTQYGESGIPISEIFKELGEVADELAVIRSMHANVPN